MPSKTDWTPAEKRALAELAAKGDTVRSVQLVAVGLTIAAALFGDWGRAVVCGLAVIVLESALPTMGPEWGDKARELDEKAARRPD